jgi:hypothetical protein
MMFEELFHCLNGEGQLHIGWLGGIFVQGITI